MVKEWSFVRELYVERDANMYMVLSSTREVESEARRSEYNADKSNILITCNYGLTENGKQPVSTLPYCRR